MAIFFQHSINATTHLGIWKIEEPELFFLQKVPLTRDVTHPFKRLQHLAGRYLLPHLFDDFPVEEIRIADTRKPFLDDEKYHFSISHCGNFAAAIASSNRRVGIDVEIVSPAVGRIAAKFLNEPEKKMLKEWEAMPNLYLQILTVIWSAKESIYKWYGQGKVDFRQHITLQGSKITINPDESIHLIFLFLKGGPVRLAIETRIFNNLVLSWVVS